MPRPRFQKLDDQRRETIMEASAQIFAENGYKGASINHILKQAGLSKGVAYYYFEDKADLFATTVEYYMAQIDINIRDGMAQLTRENFWEIMLKLISDPFLQNMDAPYRFGVLKTATTISQDDPLFERIAPILQQAFGWTAQVIETGKAFGLVRTDLPDALLFGFIHALDEVADNYLLERMDSLSKDEVVEIQRKVVDGIRRLLSP